MAQGKRAKKSSIKPFLIMSYLSNLQDQLEFIKSELAKNPTPEKWKILDSQQDSLMSELANVMVEGKLL